MLKKEAEAFLPLVNNYAAMESLSAYVDYRIAKLEKDFYSVSSLEDLKALQRRIEELKRFKTLRDEVLAAEG